MPEFQSFVRVLFFLHHFVLAKLATNSIRVKQTVTFVTERSFRTSLKGREFLPLSKFLSHCDGGHWSH